MTSPVEPKAQFACKLCRDAGAALVPVHGSVTLLLADGVRTVSASWCVHIASSIVKAAQ